MLALIFLGSAFGIASTTVNAAIAAIATYDAVERMSAPDCSMMGCVFLFCKLYFLLGYSLANAGMALEYPPIPSDIIGWTDAIINFIVYFAIGNMSFDKFFVSLENGRYAHFKGILEGAKIAREEGSTLEAYYLGLDPKDRHILVRIMKDYSNWAFDSLKDFCNYSSDEILSNIFTADMQAKLQACDAQLEKRKEGKAAGPESKTASQPPLQIVIEQPGKVTIVIEKPTEKKDTPTVTSVPATDQQQLPFRDARTSLSRAQFERDGNPFELPRAFSRDSSSRHHHRSGSPLHPSSPLRDGLRRSTLDERGQRTDKEATAPGSQSRKSAPRTAL